MSFMHATVCCLNIKLVGCPNSALTQISMRIATLVSQKKLKAKLDFQNDRQIEMTPDPTISFTFAVTLVTPVSDLTLNNGTKTIHNAVCKGMNECTLITNPESEASL